MSPAPPFRRLIATLVAGGDCRLASHGAAAYLDPIIPASNRRIMARRILILALLGLFTLGTPARAQDSVAPYDATLQRLAEILGALHYLRGICGANEGQKWRNQMQALVDAEAPTGSYRAIALWERRHKGDHGNSGLMSSRADMRCFAGSVGARRAP